MPVLLPALPQVAYKYGVDTHNLLKEAGANITFKTYNGMAHSVSGEMRSFCVWAPAQRSVLAGQWRAQTPMTRTLLDY